MSETKTSALEALHQQEAALASPTDYLSHGQGSVETEAVVATRPDGRPDVTDAAQQPESGIKVYLNTYDLLPPTRDSAKGLSSEVLTVIGMGLHHSGVEILGQEYSFGSDESGRNDPTTEGVYAVYPRTACGHFRAQIELGDAPPALTVDTLEDILVTLRPKWRASTYHILGHNCNNFTMALVQKIDELFPEGTPEDKKLMKKYPFWVNRAATSANVVMPAVLLRSIMDAVNPPAACAPDLVNFIDIPAFEGDYPPPLPPQTLPSTNRWAPPLQPTTPTTTVEVSQTPVVTTTDQQQPQWGPANTVPTQPTQPNRLGLGGLATIGDFAKKLVHSVAGTIRTSAIAHVDESDKKDYISSFEGVRADDLLSSYSCTVIHVNRPQKAKVFIAVDGVRIKGVHNLQLFIPYKDIHQYYYGAVIRPERADGNALPCFVPTEDPNAADCMLLILQIEDRGPGLRMIPLIDFTYLGGVVYANTAGRFVAKSRDVLKNAMAYFDFAYRAATTSE